MKTSKWTVTYTKHVKQKRKVYQDGVLEISGNKVALFDDSEKLIDNRFLKKDEVVECGGMLTFETHLVDIGEPEGCHMASADQDVHGKDLKLKERGGLHGEKPDYAGKWKSSLHSLPSRSHADVSHGSMRENKKDAMQNEATQKHLKLIASNNTEWNALYTSQITQKSKRFHDGILQVVSCGSLMNQAVLLSQDRTVLCSRYLKTVECIETGHEYQFPNYLVQICDLRTPPGEEYADDHTVQVDDGDADEKELTNTNANIICGLSGVVTGGLNSDNGRSAGITNRQIRDASQILSSLKRPAPFPQCSHDITLDGEKEYKLLEVNARKNTEGNHAARPIVVDGDSQGKPPHKQSISSNLLPGELAVNSSTVKLDLEDRGMKNDCLTSSITGPVPSRTDTTASPKVIQIHSPEDAPPCDKFSGEPVNNTSTDKILPSSGTHLGDCLDAETSSSLSDEIMALQYEWTSLSHRISTVGDVKHPRSPAQNNAHTLETSEMVCPPGKPSPACTATDAGSKHADLPSVSRPSTILQDFPSFDLGFD